jgi:predicted PurR-regulated permease PerM
MTSKYDFLKKTTLVIIFFIVLIYALIAAQSFIVPLLLAMLFSYLLFPVVEFLEKHGFPRIPSILVAIFLALGLIVLGINFLSSQFAVFAEDLPAIQEQAATNWESMKRNISSTTGISEERLNELETDVRGIFEASDAFFRSLFTTTTNLIVQAFLMPVFIFFMLYYRNKFHDFVIQMAPEHQAKETEVVLAQVNLVTKKYMTGVFIVVMILCVTHSVAFMIIGLDYPIFFGVVAALFNFIPYFGTLIGAVLPLSYAFFAMDSTAYSLWVLGYFVVIQFLENNILTPTITGGYVHLNPFITILALIFGSMIWGIAGMFLIVPLVAMVKIICDHISFLKPIGFLISNKGMEKHSLTVDKIKSLFKGK